MPKFRMTHHKPKPWGRRAKPDGSCHPNLKKPKYIRQSKLIRFYQWIQVLIFVPLGMVAGTIMGLSFVGSRNFFPSIWYSWVFDLIGLLNKVGLLLAVAMFFIIIVSSIGIFLEKKRLKNRALQIRCLGCPRCGYDLSGRTGDTQPCPECGLRISRRECRRMWCKALRR